MYLTKTGHLALAVAGAGALIATSASAGLTASVTDQASVQSGLAGGGVVEDFEGFATQDFPTPSTQAFNGFTASADQASGFAGDFAIGDGQVLELFADDGNVQSFTFDFDSSINTFGVQFGAANPAPGSGLFFELDNGESIDLNSNTAAGYTGNEYVALVSTSTFTSFTVSSNAGLDFFTLDNVVTGVPSPGSVAVIGMAGLAAARRRR